MGDLTEYQQLLTAIKGEEQGRDKSKDRARAREETGDLLFVKTFIAE